MDKIYSILLLFKKVIHTSIVDTFEFIELLIKHYDENMLNALHSIQMEEYEKVRFNCYYLSKLLKNNLSKYGIKTEYITYQSDNFSTDIGDKIIKELHISIVWVTKKKNKKLFVLFDTGLYIEKTFVFFQNFNSKKIKIKKCIFQIKNNNSKDYQMIQTIDGINRKGYSIEKYHLIKKLNPYYTTNVEDMLFPISMCLIPGFKISKTNGKNGAITKVVPRFKYVDKVYLNNKSRDEKLALIKQYLDSSYYITAEVLGDTPGRQHWVAVTKVENNSIFMIDSSLEQMNMWNAYNYANTSQFNYFKVR